MAVGLRQIGEASVRAILFWRSAGMVPVLLAFVWWNAGGRPMAAVRSVGLAGLVGGLGLVFAFAGAIRAFETTTVGNAVLLFAAAPFVAAILARVILGETASPATHPGGAVLPGGVVLNAVAGPARRRIGRQKGLQNAPDL